jgi:GR25 family glycosyltransferase involved in LPS biosynthesis
LNKTIVTAGMKTLVINLDSAKERWTKVSEELFSKGMNDVERISGTLGKSMTKVEKSRFATPGCTLRCPHTVLGVSVSHRKAWERAADLKCNVLICEDDVVLTDHFRSLLQEGLREAPSDWEIVWAGCLFCEEVSEPANLILKTLNWRGKSKNISKKLWVPPYAFGSHCYVLSTRGVHKLLQGQISESVDIRLNRMLKNEELKGYAFKKPIASQQVRVGVSSMTSQFPSLPNTLLDKSNMATNVSVAYGLSFPLWRHGNVNVNGWSFIFFLTGILAGIGFKFFPSVVLAISIFDIASDPQAVFAALIFFFVGFAFVSAAKTSLSKVKNA